MKFPIDGGGGRGKRKERGITSCVLAMMAGEEEEEEVHRDVMEVRNEEKEQDSVGKQT